MKNSVLLLIVFCTLLHADTLLVPSEYPDIFSAISAAQDGDTVLVFPGHYNGGFSFQGKNIVLRSSGGASNTFIESPFSFFHCVMFTGGEDSTAVLEGFSITNMDFDGKSHEGRDPVANGGGIYITNSSPTIRNNVIINCEVSEFGGGIYIMNSSSCLTENTITDSYAHGTSGGIRAGGSSVSEQPLRIIDCTISNNEAQITGGVSITHSNAEIINNTIINNLGLGQGAGGIGINSPSVLLISNYISGNDGGRGGGVAISGNVSLIGNIIVENQAGIGGGVACYGNYLLMENNTICMNTALSSTYGTGGLSITQCDTAFVTNNIIWGNQAPNGTVPNILIYDTYITISYSNIGGGIDSIWIDPTSTLIWGPGNIDIDPQFETGPLGDYHLSYGSPCIDAGNPDWEYNDPEDPFNPGYALWPAMGTTRNDMGAFGGGGVNYWLTVEEEESSAPETALVLKSFPNPFSSSCTVCYQLEYPSQVNLSVFDLSGRLVETLVDEVVPAGMYSEYLYGSGLCSGIYLIRLVADEHAASRRCVIVRDD
ncbi:MAG: right-handed parallel beta-helix repeat-containing protein [Candidatus Aegiribacteria sp.]|nr:right-handed parallel beta-helix repeat-containing protein [Candidatus Aegiribacteria sp.]